MISLYKIDGTSNIHKEQHSDCYTDDNSAYISARYGKF